MFIKIKFKTLILESKAPEIELAFLSTDSTSFYELKTLTANSKELQQELKINEKNYIYHDNFDDYIYKRNDEITKELLNIYLDKSSLYTKINDSRHLHYNENNLFLSKLAKFLILTNNYDNNNKQNFFMEKDLNLIKFSSLTKAINLNNYNFRRKNKTDILYNFTSKLLKREIKEFCDINLERIIREEFFSSNKQNSNVNQSINKLNKNSIVSCEHTDRRHYAKVKI